MTRPGRHKHLRPQIACGSLCWSHISPGNHDNHYDGKDGDDVVDDYDDDDGDDAVSTNSYWWLCPGPTPWGDGETCLKTEIRIMRIIEMIGRFVIKILGIVRIMSLALLFGIGSHDMSSYSLALGSSIGKNIPWLLGWRLEKEIFQQFSATLTQILVKLTQILVELSYIMVNVTWAITKVSKSSRIVQMSSLA